MTRKIPALALILALLSLAVPVGTAKASPGEEKEIVIKTLHVPHYDTWLHSDGVTWTAKAPGQVASDYEVDILPKAISDKYILVRDPEVTTEITPELYAQVLSPDLQQRGWWGHSWDDFEAEVYKYRPLEHYEARTVTRLDDPNSQAVLINFTFKLSPYAPRSGQYASPPQFPDGLSYVYPFDLRKVQEENGQHFEPNVEGWRWKLPIVVTWYLKERPKPPDFYVKSLNPGTGEVEEGKRYTGTVVFGLKDTVSGPVQARLELTHNGYSVPGVDGQVVEFRPGEEKSFTFSFTGQNRDSVLEAKIRPVSGEDANWNNNSKRIVVPLKRREELSSGSGLIFQAVSQTRTKTRPPGTAKWTDWVTAILAPLRVESVVSEGESPDYSIAVAPRPPEYHGFTGECSTDYSRIINWRIVSAKLTYPKQHPNFTIGCPYPPLSGYSVVEPGGSVIVDSSGGKSRGSVILDPKKTVTVGMKVVGDGHKAQAEFQEMWGLDGAKVYCLLEQRMMAAEPKYYTLCAHDIQVEVEYEVVHHVLVCDEFDCWCETEVHGPYVYRYSLAPITGRLLVNGTGVDSRAQ